ncbi:MAG: WD40 repeat domain-containing protein [Anaerolineae bacterium]|nr:WD40 repeat domain-containing protein [Anaerolineae bacterium]
MKRLRIGVWLLVLVLIGALPGMFPAAAQDDDHPVITADNADKLFALHYRSRFADTFAWSPDGTQIALGTPTGIKIYPAVVSGYYPPLIRTYGRVYSVAFSPDGRFIAGGDDAGELRAWDAETRLPRWVKRAHEPLVWSVIYNRDGTLISGGDDGVIRVWDAATGDMLREITGQRSAIYQLALHPDGVLLATGSGESLVRVWDITDGTQVAELSGHGTEARAVAYSPDGAILASGGGGPDDTVRLWDAQTGEALAVLDGFDNTITSLAWSPDGSLLAVGTSSGLLHLRDMRGIAARESSGVDLPVFEAHSPGVHTLAFNPDGTILASAGLDSRVRLWVVP